MCCMSTRGTTQSVSDLTSLGVARVGVVADTHVGEWRTELPSAIFDALAGVDVILHAGDLTQLSVLDDLAHIAPVVAVQGDHDRAAGIALPRVRVVEVAGRRIGVTHGRRHRLVETLAGVLSLATGRPRLVGLHRSLRRRFGPVDCIVYGHLHLPCNQEARDGVLFFSPGAIHNPEHAAGLSADGLVARRYLRFRQSLPRLSRQPAVGVLDITPAAITGRVIPIDVGSSGVVDPTRG